MITNDELLTALNAAGFTPATLTAFLVSGKLALELNMIDAKIRNAEVARTQASQETETAIQALQAMKQAKQAEIDSLGK